MANESNTYTMFREYLKGKECYSNIDIVVEEQQSDNTKINKLLKNASEFGEGKWSGLPGPSDGRLTGDNSHGRRGSDLNRTVHLHPAP